MVNSSYADSIQQILAQNSEEIIHEFLTDSLPHHSHLRLRRSFLRARWYSVPGVCLGQFSYHGVPGMDRMQNPALSWITGARHLESSFATARSRSTCTCTSIQILAKFVA